MRRLLDASWPILRHEGVSWMGFYEADAPAPATTCMRLVQREPKPACSPIGLHGACGQALTSGRALVVRDVADLGQGYIACDPRDRSELVVPCFDEGGQPWGVIDLDSHELGRFDDEDAASVGLLLRMARLSSK